MTRDLLVGLWHLVSVEAKLDDGEVGLPFGSEPRGRLIYDAAGNVAVQIMTSGRAEFTSGDRGVAAPEEVWQAFDGFIAYWGTYAVDETNLTVTHHVEGSLFPNDLGKNQRRHYALIENRLTLRTEPTVRYGKQRTVDLVWQRPL